MQELADVEQWDNDAGIHARLHAHLLVLLEHLRIWCHHVATLRRCKLNCAVVRPGEAVIKSAASAASPEKGLEAVNKSAASAASRGPKIIEKLGKQYWKK